MVVTQDDGVDGAQVDAELCGVLENGVRPHARIEENRVPIGFDKGRTFDDNIKEEVLKLAPGDRICVYTDGVIEAMNAASEEFGIEKCTEVLTEQPEISSKAFTESLVAALEKHRKKAEQSDDITIVTLKVT